MNSDQIATLALGAAIVMLWGCQHPLNAPVDAAEFGEPNRQTMMAQVVDPDPQYEEPIAPTSAEHAAQAAERYRTDTVKRPVRVRSTQNVGSGGN